VIKKINMIHTETEITLQPIVSVLRSSSRIYKKTIIPANLRKQYDFKRDIKPALLWVTKHDIWSPNVISLACLSNKKGSDDRTKFEKIIGQYQSFQKRKKIKGERSFEEKRANPKTKQEYLETRTPAELKEIDKQHARDAARKKREDEYDQMKFYASLDTGKKLNEYNRNHRRKINPKMIADAIEYMKTKGKAFEMEIDT
jgi:hypothetical protein